MLKPIYPYSCESYFYTHIPKPGSVKEPAREINLCWNKRKWRREVHFTNNIYLKVWTWMRTLGI